MPFLRTLIRSFYSATLYRSLRGERGYRLGYSFKLVALTTLIMTISALVLLHHALFTSHHGRPPVLEDVVHQIADQLPLMTLRNGQLMTQHPTASVVHVTTSLLNTDIDADVLTIDTTDDASADTMQTPVLITSHDLVVSHHGEKRITALQEYATHVRGPLVINRALIQATATQVIAYAHHYLPLAYLVIGTLGWLLFTLTFYLLRILMLAVLSVLGLIIARIFSVPMDYALIMRLTAVSYTPVALLALLMLLTSGYSIHATGLFVGGFATLMAALCMSRDVPLATSA